MSTCSNCVYYYQEGDDNYPFCHWESCYPGDQAPCDYEDDYEEEAE